jgi:hypothetical protein
MTDLIKINKKISSLLRELSKTRLREYEIRSLDKYNNMMDKIRERINYKKV